MYLDILKLADRIFVILYNSDNYNHHKNLMFLYAIETNFKNTLNRYKPGEKLP